MPKAKPKRRAQKKSSSRILLSRRFSKPQLLLVVGLLTAGGLAWVVASRAAGPGYDTSSKAFDSPGQSRLKYDRRHGVSYDGLKLVKKDANHPCRGSFEVEGIKTTDNKPLCTHGPDSSLEIAGGTDITQVTPTQRLNQLNRASQKQASTAELAAMAAPAGTANGSPDTFTNPYPQAATPCTSSGYRIKLVLISNIPANTYTTLAANLLHQTAKRMESQLEYSALHSGPGSKIRRFRFVTDSGCQPTVATILTPATTSLSNYAQVTTALANRGYNNTKTKYLTWVYANTVNFCGIGSVSGDSQPSAAKNASNLQTGYALIGPSCWGTGAELHELTHTLGAVANIAPHASSNSHCIDDHDIMCYPDAPDGTVAANGKAVYVAPACTAPSLEFLLDCNKNDYFNSGTVSPSNFLYNHWNVAKSPYLQ